MERSPIFDSGFKIGKLLRHEPFRKMLEDAGWVNGGRVMGVTEEVTVGQMLEALTYVDKGEPVTVVASRWMNNPAGAPLLNQWFRCFTVTVKR